jgi:hypothetical protein
MPVIEQEQIERIVSEATLSGGQLSAEKARIMNQFLAQMNDRARVIYDSALTLSAQMYEREKIAEFWKSQREVFEAQLALASRLKRKIKPSDDLPTEELLYTLDSVIATLDDLISATSEHYEFHA